MPPSLTAELTAIVGQHGVLTPDDDLARYQESPNNLAGIAALVVRPASVDEVCRVLATCRTHGARVVPQGANTGLVGAGLPDDSGTQVILSTERMRQTFDLDLDSRTLTVSAGWRLSDVNQRLAESGLRLPIEVGSDPSVGGMVSTNIAGSNVIRYGDARRRTLGVQAVLADPDTTVLDLLRPLRKQNEGFDLTQLFIGTGGTFGIVTAVSFELVYAPSSRATAWIAIPDGRTLPRVLRTFERRCGEWLTAFELVSRSAVALLAANHAALVKRLPPADGDRVLVEVGTSWGAAQDILVDVLRELDERGLIGDTVVGPPEELWEVRHVIPTITERMSPVLSFDVATPRGKLNEFRTTVIERIAARHPDLVPVELGHYGDGGLHLILPLTPATDSPDARSALVQLVYDTAVLDFDGTFSAEHGVGPKNADTYLRLTPPAARALTDRIREAADPAGILGWR